MSAGTAIEWTEETWNPVVGCSIHSPGCIGCYAMPVAWRLMHNPHPRIAAKFAGTARLVKGKPIFTGKVNLDEKTLLAPLRRKTPTLYFVNSLSDLFHANVPDEWVERIFAVMAAAHWHTFQVLTKRPERMRAFFAETWQPAPQREIEIAGKVHVIPAESRRTTRMDRVNEAMDRLDFPFHRHNRFWTPDGSMIGRPDHDKPLPNVWLGTSVEDQKRAFERIPELLMTPAAIRFLSCEPLIGAVDLLPWLDPTGACCGGDMRCANCPADAEWRFSGRCSKHDMAEPQLHWVICGGESGTAARPMHPDWARHLREQCAEAGVPFFFKQWGEWGPDTGPDEDFDRQGFQRDRVMEGAGPCAAWTGDGWRFAADGYVQPLGNTDGQWVYRLGRKRNARLLDGVTHDGMPEFPA